MMRGRWGGEAKCEVAFGEMENVDGCLSEQKRRGEVIHQR